MTRRFAIGPAFVAFGGIVVLLVGGCSISVPYPTWEPVDQEAFMNVIENPTGDVCAPTVGEALETFEELVPWLAEQQATIREIQDALTDLTGNESGAPPKISYDPEGDDSGGTALFLEFACPGLDADNPSHDFSQGMIRFDSPRLTRTDGVITVLNGNIRLLAVDCVFPSVLVQGSSPGFLDLNSEEIGLQNSIDFTLLSGEIISVRALTLYTDLNIAVSWETNGATYTGALEFAPDGSAASAGVVGANGTLGCTLTDSLDLSCEEPDCS